MELRPSTRDRCLRRLLASTSSGCARAGARREPGYGSIASTGCWALWRSGLLRLHPWGATVDDIDWPDTLVFDLDPGDGVAWSFLVETALSLRELLRSEGHQPWPKLTGGKGLHVMVPITGQMDWSSAKAYTRRLAEKVAAMAPNRYTTAAALAKRPGRLFIPRSEKRDGNGPSGY
jgi:DNA primase